MDTPTKNAETGMYKEAITEYETLETIELNIPVMPYDKSRYSLVKFTPKTGRMHQLRIHANKISHPIVGDYQYGDRFHNLQLLVYGRCDLSIFQNFQLQLF